MASATVDKRDAVFTSSAVRVQAPAKVNLSLVVFERGDDGFHELHTVMAAVDLHDDLHIRLAERPGVYLHCTGVASPSGPANLVYQAAELMARHTGMKCALEIHLHKRIPAGAGLGGGSSDAAACLLGLNRLWQADLNADELGRLGAELGSDVPFFVHGPVALCTGRGEVVRAIPHRCQRQVLLIMPKIHVPTAEVYGVYRPNAGVNEKVMERVHYFLRFGDLDGLVVQGINSLCGTCLGLFEELGELKDKIQALGIEPLHLSGSGSCLFATSASREEINLWAEQIKQLDCEADVQVVSFKDRASPYVEVHHGDF